MTNKWLDPLKGLHKVVIEAKWEKIEVSLSKPPYRTSDNHRKEVEAENALS